MRIKKSIMPMLLIVTIPIVNIFYGLLDNSKRGVYSLVTGFDRAIPFLKIFIVPYIAWYPFIFLTLLYFCMKDRNTYYETLLSLLIGLVICYVIYFLFQTTVPRPVVKGNDLLSRMVRLIYSTDKPFNCFPSIHVLTSYIMIRGAFRHSNRNIKSMLIITVLAAIIIISTLFVKQHVLLDAFSGVLLGDFIFDSITRFEIADRLRIIPKWTVRYFSGE